MPPSTPHGPTLRNLRIVRGADMARNRWRRTRRAYRKATSLQRYFDRHVYDLPSEPPTILRRLRELLARHPQRDAPLLQTLAVRRSLRWRDFDDSIPF